MNKYCLVFWTLRRTGHNTYLISDPTGSFGGGASHGLLTYEAGVGNFYSAANHLTLRKNSGAKHSDVTEPIGDQGDVLLSPDRSWRSARRGRTTTALTPVVIIF